jgi:hypothetical protein
MSTGMRSSTFAGQPAGPSLSVWWWLGGCQLPAGWSAWLHMPPVMPGSRAGLADAKCSQFLHQCTSLLAASMTSA